MRADPVEEALGWSRLEGRLGSVLSTCMWLGPSGSQPDNEHSLNSYATHTVLGTMGDGANTKETETICPAPKELV